MPVYRGRVQLGQEITLGVQVHDANDTPAEPTTAANGPWIEVWSTSAKVLTGKTIPIQDRYGATGYFQYNLFLDARFTAGQYKCLYRFVTGTYYGLDEDTFEIVAGGNVSGALLGMAFYSRPHADFLVWQTDGGVVQKGRNPVY